MVANEVKQSVGLMLLDILSSNPTQGVRQAMATSSHTSTVARSGRKNHVPEVFGVVRTVDLWTCPGLLDSMETMHTLRMRTVTT